MRLFLFILMSATAFVAFMALCVMAFDLTSPHPDQASAIISILFMTPFFVSIGVNHLLRSRAKRKFTQFVAKQGGSDFADFTSFTGLALSKSRKVLYIAQGNSFKSYSFDLIRSWKKISSGNLLEDGDPVSTAGLHIDVKDVANPAWHIRLNRNRSNIWFEILQQHVNE